jgi:serine protease Do
MNPNPQDFQDPPVARANAARRSWRLRALKGALAATVLSAAVGGFLFGNNTAAQGIAPHPVAATAPAATIPHELNDSSPFSFADLVQHVSPAVVTVVVEHSGPAQVADQTDEIPAPFRDFFRQFGQGQGQGLGRGQGQGRQRQPQAFRGEARGAGFIIEGNGYIVTNNHVVDGGNKVTVKLPDGREFQAKVVGTDKDTDVALLHVDAKNLPTVAFGDDRRVRVGDWVVAVGNPFGLGGTVTAGIVSSIGRDIGNGPYTDYLQIDAPINQGNSGGPTFDISGRVVGMNTAIYSPSGGSVGIGFAIPASTVRAVVDQLKEHGSVARGYLGVQIQSLTPDMAASIGASDAKGAIIASVVDDSPAARAGMKQGDIIVSLDGAGISDSRELTRKVALVPAGSKVDFTVMRDGHKQNISVTIGKRNDQTASADTPSRPGNRQSSESTLGMELAPLNPETRQDYRLGDNSKGVVVTSVNPDSDAADKGLHSGDVIMSVGGREVRTPADVRSYVADAKRAGRTSVLMLVDGSDGQHFLTVKVG